MTAKRLTWIVVAIVALAVGAAAVRFLLPEPRVVVAGGTHEIVSRAADSETEVSPSLAASGDGTLVVAWVAMGGGQNEEGRYVGVRVSAPGAGALGPLVRLSGGVSTAPPALAALGSAPDAFLVAWRSGTEVYAARVSRVGASTPVRVTGDAGGGPAAAAAGDTVRVVVIGDRGSALWSTHDGVAFSPRALPGVEGALVTVCGDERSTLVAWLDAKFTVKAAAVPLDPEIPVLVTTVSSPGDHVARQAPTCFVSGPDAYVAYGTTDPTVSDAERPLVVALSFARSTDQGRTFSTRAAYRPAEHLLHPAILRDNNSFKVLALMGSGLGDLHGSASLLVLGADGHSQSGLTSTVASPITLVASPDGAGYTGEALGIAEVAGITWAAVPDNASGESHIALVQLK